MSSHRCISNQRKSTLNIINNAIFAYKNPKIPIVDKARAWFLYANKKGLSP